MQEQSKLTGNVVKLPPDLKRWLQHEAIDNRRSLTKEIIHRLEQSRAQQMARGAQQ